MSKLHPKINLILQKFIATQKIFLVATAPTSNNINLPQKGTKYFKIIHKNHFLWLNINGSGNEISTHLFKNQRITMMFCFFEKIPNILRL